MSTLYLDSSAIIRILGSEGGPRAPIQAPNVATTSELADLEVRLFLHSARHAGRLSPEEFAVRSRALTQMLDRFHVFPVGSEMIEHAKHPPSMPVSVLHALHLATAQLIQEETGPLEFWTHVHSQAVVGVAAGLDVRGHDVKS